MCEALDELYKEEIDKRVNKLADAKAEALAKEHLTNQIKKKIAKGKSLAQIADELEEEEEIILPLYTQLIKNSN